MIYLCTSNACCMVSFCINVVDKLCGHTKKDQWVAICPVRVLSLSHNISLLYAFWLSCLLQLIEYFAHQWSYKDHCCLLVHFC